jgi:hypothetical protein
LKFVENSKRSLERRERGRLLERRERGRLKQRGGARGSRNKFEIDRDA